MGKIFLSLKGENKMKFKKTKFIALCLVAVFVFFFSNDFGIIDIEKTAIITAVAIDITDNGEYEVTAQIAVPEATDANTENKKAQISGTGSTVASAVKNIGDISGWFPSLSFCNIIIVGNKVAQDNVIKVLDYFSNTLRMQDSALVILSEKDAKSVLTTSTPLDNISSFALQKIIYKNPGFDNDITHTDIKTFCVGYYSYTKSAIMPMVKIIKETEDNDSVNGGGGGTNSGLGSGSASSESGASSGGGSSSSGGGSSGDSSSGASGSGNESSNSNKGSTLFDARTTALFYDGKLVGSLLPHQTLAYNMLKSSFAGTTIEVTGVKQGLKTANYLLTAIRTTPKIKVFADENSVNLDLSVNVYCRLADENTKESGNKYLNSSTLPYEVIERAEEQLTDAFSELIEISKQTGCDFLELKKQIYRHQHKYYAKYKDEFFNALNVSVNVKVSGQK